MRYAKFGLLALTTLGLFVWSGYVAVAGVIGNSAGRVGAGVAGALGLAAATWCGTQLIRWSRSEGNGH